MNSKMILKSARFVPFDANVSQFGGKSGTRGKYRTTDGSQQTSMKRDSRHARPRTTSWQPARPQVYRLKLGIT